MSDELNETSVVLSKEQAFSGRKGACSAEFSDHRRVEGCQGESEVSVKIAQLYCEYKSPAWFDHGATAERRQTLEVR
jgi:hypothetical protein